MSSTLTKNRIVQLDAVLSNQIAAGEVVERPASVVKELVENSIDAGATEIDIDIEGGGMHLIRIRDNGEGILKADLPLAFSRHATSKIHSIEDLAHIASLGFRGEALASIAAVSRCRLLSQSHQQENAWQIQIAPDLTPKITPAAHPRGTTIEVADLFYNTPVRRRFLRSEKTEFQYIDEVIKRLALSRSDVSFRLKHQQRQVRYYPSAIRVNSENVRIGKICGDQFIQQAMRLSGQSAGLTLKGWLGLPSMGRRQPDCQYFFVNLRIIKDRLVNHVIKTLFQQHALLQEGSYPCYVLYLTLDPCEVDVNVHPTKQEVRFAEPRLIHDFIAKCIEQACQQQQVFLPEQSVKPPLVSKVEPSKSLSSEPLCALGSTISGSQQRYILVEEQQGVVIIDWQQALPSLLAFYFAKNAGQIPTKALLFPLRCMLTDDCKAEKKYVQLLGELGFVIRFIDKRQVLILQQPVITPAGLSESAVNALLMLVSTSPEKSVWLNEAGKWFAEVLTSFPESLKALIPDWINCTQIGPFLRLPHERIVSL